jgi:hypothetical protein
LQDPIVSWINNYELQDNPQIYIFTILWNYVCKYWLHWMQCFRILPLWNLFGTQQDLNSQPQMTLTGHFTTKLFIVLDFWSKHNQNVFSISVFKVLNP